MAGKSADTRQALGDLIASCHGQNPQRLIMVDEVPKQEVMENKAAKAKKRTRLAMMLERDNRTGESFFFQSKHANTPPPLTQV